MSSPGRAAAPFESDEHYRQLRRKLILYFERRNCGCAEDLADDCLNRVFLYIQEHAAPASLDRFIYGFASRGIWSSLSVRHRVSHRFRMSPAMTGGRQRTAEGLRSLAETSVGQLAPAMVERLEQYYLDRRSANSLAKEWGLSPEGIRSRVFRQRRRLVQYFTANKNAERERNGQRET